MRPRWTSRTRPPASGRGGGRGAGRGPGARSGVLLLGLFLGLVRASAVRAVPAETEDPIRILHADRMPMDRGQDVLVLEGHVRLAKGDTVLSGQHMKWLRSRRTLEISGDVSVQNKTSRLSSEHLLYDLEEDAVTAWGRPRLRQSSNQGLGEDVVMRAVQLRLFPGEGRVEAIEDVEVEQTRGQGAERAIEMRVTCRVAEVLARGKRNIFKGDVRVETPDIGAEAGRMLFEQESRRVYLLDGARVWNYDSRGRRLDELQGDKVIYFLDEARTVALGGVRATVIPEGEPGQRTLLRTRRSLGE